MPALIDRLEQKPAMNREHYEDVLASRLIARDGDRVQVFMKLRRTNLITVTYNTEHVVDYTRIATERASARSVATKIAELADTGTPQEREKSADEDNGFLWRSECVLALRSGTGRRAGRMRIGEPEPSSPTAVRPVANPIVDRIARESLTRTLADVCAASGVENEFCQLPAERLANREARDLEELLNFYLEQLRPELAGHEQPIAGRVVRNPVQHTATSVDLLCFARREQPFEIDPGDNPAGLG